MSASVYEMTVLNQRAAASPDQSVFVAANAGAGKTRVLTDRVARLLLQGTDPGKILCITFTKAAAAEMASRLYDLLGKWALSDDETLKEALTALMGAGVDHESPDHLAAARRLFARALETPGGLKIQTIHSFCESLLRRFPVESGVSPGFTVIDDAEKNALLESAFAAMAKASFTDTAVAESLRVLTKERAADTVKSIILERAKLGDVPHTGKLRESLADLLGITPQMDADAIMRAYTDGLDRERIKALAGVLLNSAGKAKERGQDLLKTDDIRESQKLFEEMRKVCLTQKGKPLKNGLMDAGLKKKFPDFEKFADHISDETFKANEQIRSVTFLNDNVALNELAGIVRTHYEAAKRARASIDFDGMITGARQLFADADRHQWIMYKLDQGIDHILLDEAQDTTPAAWSVIDGPLREFIAGAGRQVAGRRTFFAVGDQKQSIYSFQGADAALFEQRRIDLGADLSAVMPYQSIPMELSFRTTLPVLRFVDAVFDRADVWDGVSQEPMKHHLFREGEGGRVEIWPLVPRPDKEDVAPWDAPLDSYSEQSAPVRLTRQISETIATWIEQGECLQSTGEPVRPRDILILVQSRSVLFHEMIRALSLAGVPVAGADKIALLEDQFVRDMISLMRAALFPHDDLSLAEALKTPFFELSEDALFNLAYGREGSLFAALKGAAETSPEMRLHLDQFERARRIGLERGPLAFTAHLLEAGSPSGRQRVTERLGAPARDPLQAFLQLAFDFEAVHPRSMRLFVSWLKENAGEVSRRPETDDDVIRIMTVHGAKGLEAPIVFLLDAHRGPNLKSSFLKLPLCGSDTRLLVGNDVTNPDIIEERRMNEKRAGREEYRRQLYVAATRARDRLYICGHESGNSKDLHKPKPPDKVWYALAEDAFDRLGDDVVTCESLFGKPVRRIDCAQTKTPKVRAASIAPAIMPMPDYFTVGVAPEYHARRLSPSRLGEIDDSAFADSPRQGERIDPATRRDALQRGTALHKALEVLPGYNEAQRRGAADRIFSMLAPDASTEDRDRWYEEVIAIIDHPTFAEVFAAGSRAEVPVGGHLTRRGQTVRVHGVIDRLRITGDQILLVDYKTNRPPPPTLDGIPSAYLAQLGAYRALLGAIYRDRPIRAAILWTYEARLTELPEKLIDDAFNDTVA